MQCKVAVIAAAVAAWPVAAAAQLPDLPPRRPGQWELRMVTEKPPGGPTIEAQMCIDRATDRDLMDFGLRMSKDSCKRYEVRRVGADWVIDSDCVFGPIKSVTKTTISGDFQSNLSVRIEGTTEGMPGKHKGPQPTLMMQTGRWLGEKCAKGMKPGDVGMPGGLKFNVKHLKALQGVLPGLQIR
jgi:hypothetical protein